MADPDGLTAVCPVCTARIPLEDFKEEGFLRARRHVEGGPYYELTCSDCRSVLRLEQSADRSRFVSLKTSGWFGFRPSSEAQHFPPDEPADRSRRGRAGTAGSGSRAEGSGHARATEDEFDFGAGFETFDERRRGEQNGRERDHRERTGGPGHTANGCETELDVERCREILGVDPRADQEAIRAAFRERSKLVHPDRFQALDEDFRALAHEKFIELQRARDRLLAIIGRAGDHEA